MNVSVIVATFGDRSWADRAQVAAVSAQTQTPPAREVILLHRDDGTLASVRNEAAHAASGDWLCFLDADDLLEPGYLAAMDTEFENPALTSSRLPIRPSLFVPALRYGAAAVPEIPAWNRSLIDLNCAVIGTLIPRHLFAAVGGFHGWAFYEDWELWLRCVRAGAKMVAVPGAVYHARSVPTGRNLDPGTRPVYDAIRDLHRDTFAWDDVARYKVSA